MNQLKALTALTGFMCPSCKIYDGGFFSKESKDPDDYSKNLKDLKNRLSDSAIDTIKLSIIELKKKRLLICEQYMNMKTLETRDGHFVIKHPYRILKNEQDDRVIISARESDDPRYVRTYIDKDGIVRNTDDRAIISRRKDIKTSDGRYQIASRMNAQER